MEQFLKHRSRYKHLSIQARKHFGMADQHQIVQRRGVCDDDHSLLNFCAFSISLSKSCSL